jgi:hypothetical protein
MRAALLAFVLICLGTAACQTATVGNTLPTPVQNVDGLRVMVAAENTQPSVLRIVLSGHPDNDPAINVIFPEHKTAKRQGACEPEHFYLFRQGQQSVRPAWKADESSFQYETDLTNGIHMLARATVENDGVIRSRFYGNAQSGVRRHGRLQPS